jgi:hypothetical protein
MAVPLAQDRAKLRVKMQHYARNDADLSDIVTRHQQHLQTLMQTIQEVFNIAHRYFSATYDDKQELYEPLESEQKADLRYLLWELCNKTSSYPPRINR